MAATTILKTGENCWRIEEAERAAILIDGEAYFRAFYEAVQQAQHSIFILSWDIDTRVQLIRDGSGAEGLPTQLGDFLNTIVNRRKGLHAYVLNWDWAMLYAFEREWLPVYKLDWKTHRRLHFHLDEEYQAGAHPLMGDLNEWFLWGRILHWLHAGFQPTPAHATFPSRWPLFALDRLWVRPRSRLVKLEVHQSETARRAADHLPLKVVIAR